MLRLILLLVAGSVLVYVSQYNIAPVSINLGWYVLSDIPLFYVIVGSFVLGLSLSYIIHLVQGISTSLLIRGKEKEIKKNKDSVLELTTRVHKLEIENEKLKHTSGTEPEDPHAL